MKFTRFIPLLILASMATFYGAMMLMPAKALADGACCFSTSECAGGQVCLVSDSCSQGCSGCCGNPWIQ